MSCIIALDVGTKTIGIATGDRVTRLASPHSTLSRKGVRKDTERLNHIATELGATAFVVGMPYELDGSEGRSAHVARQIGTAVATAASLPVHYQYERFSTVEADRRLMEAGHDGRKRRIIIEQAAAAVILQDWLDRAGD